MTRVWRFADHRWVVLWCTALPLTTGCALTRQGRQVAPVVSAERRAAPADTQHPAEETGNVSLAAVEDFLARTDEYQVSKPTALDADRPLHTSEAETRSAPTPMAATPRIDKTPAQPRLTAERETVYANTHVALSLPEVEEPMPPLPVVEMVSIRVPASAEAPPPKPEVSAPTNQPVTLDQPQPQSSPDAFVRQLEATAERDKDADSEWTLRLVQLALHRKVNDEAMSTEMSSDSRRMLKGILRIASAVRTLANDPLQTGEDALDRLLELSDVVGDRADPIVSTISLCRRVTTFGVYEEMDPEILVAGRSQQTIVYSEVRNLRSELTEAGHHRTALGTRLELLTADGDSVWQQEEPEIVDVCRRRRHDFFIAQRVTFPSTLAAGDYVLKVLVEDKLSGKANEATHRISIGSTTTLTANR